MAAPVEIDQDAVSEGRFDPIGGQWTIIAGNRSQRPEEFCDSGEQTRSDLECPFCAGHEDSTPAPVWTVREPVDADQPALPATSPAESSANPSRANWLVRVVPNKYPAVGPLVGNADSASPVAASNVPPFKAPPSKAPAKKKRNSTDLLMPHRRIVGGHEVIIESSRHVRSVSDLDIDEVQASFAAYADRIRHWYSMPEIAHVSVFKNAGSDAGASLSHCHSQLVATDYVPDDVRSCFRRMHRHKVTTGCCLQCDLIREEQRQGERVIAVQNGLIAFCPFASHLPMMLRITTTDHRACLSDLDSEGVSAVARLVHRAVGWIERSLGPVAYNFIIHCHPKGMDDSVEAYHWSLDLFPRLTKIAGFEWNTGTMINPTPPELAAATYREQAKAESPRRWLSKT